MELITAKETLDFLSKSAPRVWIKRMLLWMIFMNEIDVYFREARSIAKTRVFRILGADYAGQDREARIRADFDEGFASKLITLHDLDEYEEVAHEWGQDADPEPVSIGYFVYATDTDWENGIVQATIYADRDRSLFSDEEVLLESEFEDADYQITLKGWCFDHEQIELLQPQFELPRNPTGQSNERPRLGRPRTWDWDGATANLLTIAQTPDGLPTGPGAQAEIERFTAEWFMATVGNSPANSQVRKHAAKIMAALKKPEIR